MIIERAEIGCHHRWSGDAASSSRVWASASSSRPRTACRSLPPALPSFGLEARTYGPLLARRGEEPRAWVSLRRSDRRHRGARFARQSTRR